MAFLTEEDKKYTNVLDICTHLGDEYGKFSGAIVPPIFQNSLFVSPTECNGVTAHGYGYSRTSNPTVDIAERKIAALEGADGALCFSSGMAAISAAIMYFVKKDCHIILAASSYSNVLSIVRDYLPDKFGVEYTFVGGDDPKEIENAIKENTTLIYLESPSTMVFKIQDLEAVAKIAKEKGIGTIIDNTYATPLHQQPLKYGIDISCHTCSKYLGGHSDIVAGAIAARKEIIRSIQDRERTWFGGCMDPHAAWLLIRGIRTLPMRLKQHGENGMKVAKFLENHPKVKKVFYPGSDTFEQKEMFAKYLSGTNGLLSFEPKGTWQDIRNFVNKLHYFQNGVSWGGFESLVALSGANPVQKEYGQPERLVRIHVGLEDIDTLINYLSQALEVLPD